jgi:transcription elongation factor SPT6
MLTEDDDLIRAQDIPERMQLATSSLSQSCALSLHKPMQASDIEEAAQWITPRLSAKKTREYFHPDGALSHLQTELVLAVSNALKFIFVDEFEVPYIWTHKRDHISYFDVKDIRTRIELISLSELWRIYAHGQKYRSLLDRRTLLEAAYARLDLRDEYYEDHIRPRISGVEVVADATEWLAMKYKDKKQSSFELHFHDDDEQLEVKKRKMPSRISAYEVAKKSIVSKLAKVCASVWYDAIHPLTRPFLSVAGIRHSTP